MTRLIKIRWRHLALFLLTLLGIVFLAIGWSGMPQAILGTKEDAKPAATLVKEDSGPEPGNNPASPAGASVITMPGDASEEGGGANYFVDSRMGRQRARGQQLETLQAIIDNPASEQGIRSEAQQSIMAISNEISTEAELESLIRAKGFDDAVVYLKDNNANVVVKSDALTPEEVARICDLVARGTGISEQNIVIIPTR